MSEAEDGVRPGRGYSWEPFQPGHTLSLRHGAFSPRKVEPRAAEYVDAVLEIASADGSTVSYLADLTYQPALVAWSRAEAQQDMIEEYIAEVGGPIDEDGKVRPAADLLERVARRAERMRTRLGLDPLSRASLARDLAVAQAPRTIEDLKRAGRELLAELERAAEPDDQDQEMGETL
jgi:hypothetical protein